MSEASLRSSTTPVLGAGIRMGQAIRDAGGRLVDIVAHLTGLSVEEVQAHRAEGSWAGAGSATGGRGGMSGQGGMGARGGSCIVAQ